MLFQIAFIKNIVYIDEALIRSTLQGDFKC